jgi:hypothetical protein
VSVPFGPGFASGTVVAFHGNHSTVDPKKMGAEWEGRGGLVVCRQGMRGGPHQTNIDTHYAHFWSLQMFTCTCTYIYTVYM